MNSNWKAKTNFDEVCWRAAGRRRYNAQRQAEALKRFKEVLKLISPPDGRKRGSQAELARALGVHRSTISRDVAKWRRTLMEAMRLAEVRRREEPNQPDILP